jgi:hypothetical protein
MLRDKLQQFVARITLHKKTINDKTQLTTAANKNAKRKSRE